MSLSPPFRSPFTDLTGAVISHQWYGVCAAHEMKVIDCLEAYGLNKGLDKCELLMKDFKECGLRVKQEKRFMAMRLERQKQYWTGQRSKEERYAPPPRADVWE